MVHLHIIQHMVLVHEHGYRTNNYEVRRVHHKEGTGHIQRGFRTPSSRRQRESFDNMGNVALAFEAFEVAMEPTNKYMGCKATNQ